MARIFADLLRREGNYLDVETWKKVLLAAVHLRSKLHTSSEHHQLLLRTLMPEIMRYEDERRTILFGDMNMDPFEPGMINADLIHAVMSRHDAVSEREVGGRIYPRFYNPMWSLYGDFGGRSPGTYRRKTNDTYCLFWHMLDQLLVRPALLDCFVESSLKILDGDGVDSFLTKRGNPRGRSSEHLPLVATFDLYFGSGKALI